LCDNATAKKRAVAKQIMLPGTSRHSRAGGNPARQKCILLEIHWIPACAGMTAVANLSKDQ
jgi:hypothetical protein